MFVETDGSPSAKDDEDRSKIHAGVLRVDPERVTARNIITSYAAYGEGPKARTDATPGHDRTSLESATGAQA